MDNQIWIAGSIFSLTIFIFLGSLLMNTLKKPANAGVLKGIMRRRVESNPNIVCGFPNLQKAREEAPFA